MIALDELCPDIVPDLERVAAEVASMAASDYAPVNAAARYIATTPGKRLRPGILLLAARACGYHGPRCIAPAAIIEVLHAVSLVHDDVIDDADRRRGGFAVRALWGNRMAVMLGDHLLAAVLKRLVENGDHAMMAAIAEAAMATCRGQMQEIISSGPGMTEEQYLDIVTAKTGSLFAVSARLGGVAAAAGRSQLVALDSFGRSFGVAYQIADDILDLTAAPQQAGKSVARDLAQGQITLPIIYSLREGSLPQRAQLLTSLDGASAGGVDVVHVRKLVADMGGLEYARARVRHFADQAGSHLHTLPQSSARECLLTLTRDGLAPPVVAGG